jgi:hypothetical protein
MAKKARLRGDPRRVARWVGLESRRRGQVGAGGGRWGQVGAGGGEGPPVVPPPGPGGGVPVALDRPGDVLPPAPECATFRAAAPTRSAAPSMAAAVAGVGALPEGRFDR